MNLIEAIEYLKDTLKEDEVVIKTEDGDIFIVKKEDAKRMGELR